MKENEEANVEEIKSKIAEILKRNKRREDTLPQRREASKDHAKELLDKYEEVKGGRVPDTFSYPRATGIKLASVEKTLFTDLEKKGGGEYVVGGLMEGRERVGTISPLDFQAFCLSIRKALHNQSYLTKADRAIEADKITKADKVTEADKVFAGLFQNLSPSETEKVGHKVYRGEVVITLNQLCRDGYGEKNPTYKQRNAMRELLWTLDENRVKLFDTGKTSNVRLVSIVDETTYNKDGSILYILYLHPLFTEVASKGFGELPQDIAYKLKDAAKGKKITSAHYRLLHLLSIQDKRKPFTRTYEELLKLFDVSEATGQNNRGRTEKQIISLCDVMVRIGIISTYEVVWKGKRLDKVTFTLNPNFLRGTKALSKEPTS